MIMGDDALNPQNVCNTEPDMSKLKFDLNGIILDLNGIILLIIHIIIGVESPKSDIIFFIFKHVNTLT
jgi:hypothetical protein